MFKYFVFMFLSEACAKCVISDTLLKDGCGFAQTLRYCTFPCVLEDDQCNFHGFTKDVGDRACNTFPDFACPFPCKVDKEEIECVLRKDTPDFLVNFYTDYCADHGSNPNCDGEFCQKL